MLMNQPSKLSEWRVFLVDSTHAEAFVGDHDGSLSTKFEYELIEEGNLKLLHFEKQKTLDKADKSVQLPPVLVNFIEMSSVQLRIC